jgi:hypothetical protein
MTQKNEINDSLDFREVLLTRCHALKATTLPLQVLRARINNLPWKGWICVPTKNTQPLFAQPTEMIGSKLGVTKPKVGDKKLAHF